MYRQGLFRLWRGLTLVTRAASVRTAVTFNRCPSTDLKLNPTRSWIVLTSSRAMAGTQGEGSSSEGTHTNRLALEKSPYLLQHASNPVDWFPWGKEAFRKAKDEDKPIFLSVGYSTCHWCHVMERESFENEDIGKLMNDYFVNIKVDREERPDVDNVYMNFVRATTGGGGWPMSVWLTPDLKPIVGGTYFPPDDRYYDRPGFKSIIINIALKWRNEREKMDEQGTVVVDALLRAATRQPADTSQVEFLPCVQRCFSMLRANYDEDHGGIGTSPKFPQPVNLNFLLKKYAEDPSGLENKVALKMVTDTLLFMAKGGIHDHIANGFHRYSTDRHWHVPHFEKMLYDQAQLAALYAETYQVTKENVFAEVARDILKYVSRDLTDPNGGFYSAEDADSLPTPEASIKKEGAFCVWSCEQLEALLSEPLADHQHLTQADIFKHHYGIKTLGNVDPYQDPHEELKGQNVLIIRAGVAETADKFCLTLEETESVLEKCRKILFDVRKTRPPPHLDNKMLTSWNGLMISGFAKAGQILDDQDYVDRATKAAHFLKTHMYNEETNTLLRSSYAGENDAVAQSPTPIEGFADDYAFLIRGLVDLYEAGLDESWLAWAEQLQEQQDALFWDTEGGAYFSSREDDKSIIIRMKEDHDGAEPCANSVSASNLVRLSYLLERPEWRHRAVDLLAAFAETLEKAPAALPEMVGAHMLLQAAPKQIVIAGDHGAEDTRALLRCVHSYYLPHKVLLLANGQEGGFLHSRLSLLPSLQRLEGRATAYVCENYSCSLPVNTVQALEEQLRSEQRESN